MTGYCVMYLKDGREAYGLPESLKEANDRAAEMAREGVKVVAVVTVGHRDERRAGDTDRLDRLREGL